MEATRLRRHFDEALQSIGVPYAGEHFLPFVSHGAEIYCLSGNRRLAHILDSPAIRRLFRGTIAPPWRKGDLLLVRYSANSDFKNLQVTR